MNEITYTRYTYKMTSPRKTKNKAAAEAVADSIIQKARRRRAAELMHIDPAIIQIRCSRSR